MDNALDTVTGTFEKVDFLLRSAEFGTVHLPSDPKGAFLSERVRQFDLAIRALKEAYMAMHKQEKQMRDKMAAVYEKLGGENNKFREEKYIPLREITLEMGVASQRVHRFLADETYAATVVDACIEVDTMMLAPIRDLLHDREERFRKYHEFRHRISVLEERIRELRDAPPASSEARRREKAEDDLRETRRRLEDADALLVNVEELVDFHFEMFEFHRVRHVRKIYTSICRSQLIHATELLNVYTPLQLHLRHGDMEPMRARESLRGCLSSAGF